MTQIDDQAGGPASQWAEGACQSGLRHELIFAVLPCASAGESALALSMIRTCAHGTVTA